MPTVPRALSNAAWDVVVNRESGIQFRASSWWLDADDALRRLIVCYDPNPAVLARRLEQALDRVGVRCSMAHLLPKGFTTMPQHASVKRGAAELSDVQRSWVRELYSDDWDLWQAHCGENALLPEPTPYCPLP